ncbi:hypothetical protein E4U40_005337 [Claviceps sp. LM458 group G5]|nr:hypothetical protein E4U40_005337 [Claviceps sp. LM458 group G5]
MLRSTYQPSAAAAAATAPLLPGWSEHTAPTGHKYYYHAETKQSTYHRPAVAPTVTIGPEPAPEPYAHLPSLADPRVANAYLAQLNAQNRPQGRGGHSGRGRGGGQDGRPRGPQPHDKPRRVEKIPNCEPWMLVYTKYSRRFAYNPVKKASYWRIPEKLTQGILELDKARIRAKASGDADGANKEGPGKEGQGQLLGPCERDASTDAQAQQDDYDSDEYEEVEVEVDENGVEIEPNPDNQHASKRRRTGDGPESSHQEANPDGAEQQPETEYHQYESQDDNPDPEPLEFTEADIAAQLQAMGDDYGLEPGDYDDGHMDEWPEGAEGLSFSHEDAQHIFRDLLNDLHINPYSPWEKLLEDGNIINDPRYTALSTTRARKQCWDDWTRDKIAHLRSLRAQQTLQDPRIAYLALLQEKATPKLYWPEFKRKYKKEDPMRDVKLSDKDREKAYREHVARLKLPTAQLKADLMALLKEQSGRDLHKLSCVESLPTRVLTDIRYVSLDAKTRDALVEAYIQSLPGPPPPPQEEGGGGGAVEDDAETKKEVEARQKRERALEARNRAVEEERRRRERDVAASKARLRDEERELEVAMRVGKRGLQSQLVSGSADTGRDE